MKEERSLAPSPCVCSPQPPKLDRRRWLYLTGGTVLASALPAWRLIADENKKYDAMAISCIDPRFQKPVHKHLGKAIGHGKYSHLAIAGAGIAGVAPALGGWHETLWSNLATSLKLHRFTKVVLVQHRGCGAATQAYGFIDFEGKPESETQLHQTVVSQFRDQLHQRHPQLCLEAVLMGLDGEVKELIKCD